MQLQDYDVELGLLSDPSAGASALSVHVSWLYTLLRATLHVNPSPASPAVQRKPVAPFVASSVMILVGLSLAIVQIAGVPQFAAKVKEEGASAQTVHAISFTMTMFALLLPIAMGSHLAVTYLLHRTQLLPRLLESEWRHSPAQLRAGRVFLRRLGWAVLVWTVLYNVLYGVGLSVIARRFQEVQGSDLSLYPYFLVGNILCSCVFVALLVFAMHWRLLCDRVERFTSQLRQAGDNGSETDLLQDYFSMRRAIQEASSAWQLFFAAAILTGLLALLGSIVYGYTVPGDFPFQLSFRTIAAVFVLVEAPWLVVLAGLTVLNHRATDGIKTALAQSNAFSVPVRAGLLAHFDTCPATFTLLGVAITPLLVKTIALGLLGAALPLLVRSALDV